MADELGTCIKGFREKLIKDCETSYINAVKSYRNKCHLQSLTHSDEDKRREYFERYSAANYIIGIIENTTAQILKRD